MNISATGKPLDLSNKEHCSIALTTDSMKLKIEGNFRQRERKLFVLMIHSVWDELGTKKTYEIETAKIKEVFRQIAGIKGFNNWLWEYLENLANIKVTFENERYRGIARLLSKVVLDNEKSIVKFEIPEELEESIKNPERYARLDTYFLIGLKGKYSVSLYQFLESKINLDKFNSNNQLPPEQRYVEVPVEDLRDWLGTGNMYKSWKDFKKRVLSPAIQEINSNPIASTFSIKTEEVKGSRRKTVSIRFFLTKTNERIELEKSIKVTQKAKEASRKSTLVPSFRGTKIYEQGGKLIPRGYDIHALEEEWREFSYKRNEAIKNPEGAFLRWLENKFESPQPQKKTGLFNSILSPFGR